ncbi:hypothetical protein EPO15_04880 [bacterium]|nr:MAG: hypothetical protein EPO15_04880 [bacterium]
MRTERGSALVQVLVMSVLLIILATGVMKVMFMNHMMVARVKSGADYRDWVDRCYANKSVAWSGVPCGGGSNDSCNFTSLGGPVVNITCQAGGRVQMTVNW